MLVPPFLCSFAGSVYITPFICKYSVYFYFLCTATKKAAYKTGHFAGLYAA